MAWFELVFLGVVFFLCYKGAVLLWHMRDVQNASSNDMKSLWRFMFPYKKILSEIGKFADEQERVRESNQRIRENTHEG